MKRRESMGTASKSFNRTEPSCNCMTQKKHTKLHLISSIIKVTINHWRTPPKSCSSSGSISKACQRSRIACSCQTLSLIDCNCDSALEILGIAGRFLRTRHRWAQKASKAPDKKLTKGRRLGKINYESFIEIASDPIVHCYVQWTKKIAKPVRRRRKRKKEPEERREIGRRSLHVVLNNVVLFTISLIYFLVRDNESGWTVKYSKGENYISWHKKMS